MNILVFMKQTFDTEARIVIKDGQVSDQDVTYVINPYDEYAVEEAIKLKEAAGDGNVTVICIGPDRAEESLRKALAMGADDAVLIDAPADADEYVLSELLAAACRQREYDLILAGNLSVDTGAGQVAVRVAELLGMPHVGTIVKLEVSGGSATVERDAEGDTEIVQVNLPALFTAQQGLNEPRYPSLPGIMRAKKKPLDRVSAADLGVDASPRTKVESVFAEEQDRRREMIGGSAAEAAAALVGKLRNEAKVI